MTHQAAVRSTRVAQVVFLAFAAAAGYVMVRGVQRVQMPELPVVGEQPVVSRVGEIQTVSIDTGASASRLGRLTNAPKLPVAAAPPPVAPTAPQTPVTPVAGATSVRYLGPVDVGPLRMALIVENDKQKFVRVGASLGGEQLAEILPEEIVLKKTDGEAHRIDLTARTGDIITHIRPGAPVGNLRPTQHPAAAAPAPPGAVTPGIPLAKEPLFQKIAGEGHSAEYIRKFEEVLGRLRATAPNSEPASLFEKARAIVETELSDKGEK